MPEFPKKTSKHLKIPAILSFLKFNSSTSMLSWAELYTLLVKSGPLRGGVSWGSTLGPKNSLGGPG